MRIALTVGVSAYVCRSFEIRSRRTWGAIRRRRTHFEVLAVQAVGSESCEFRPNTEPPGIRALGGFSDQPVAEIVQCGEPLFTSFQASVGQIWDRSSADRDFHCPETARSCRPQLTSSPLRSSSSVTFK